jgi:hypothetical protein
LLRRRSSRSSHDRHRSPDGIDKGAADLSPCLGVQRLSKQELGGDLQAQLFDGGKETEARAATPLCQRLVDDRVDDVEVAAHRGGSKRRLHDVPLGAVVIEIAEHEAPLEELANREIPTHSAREVRPTVEKKLANEIRLANRQLYKAEVSVREIRPKALPTRL